MLIYTIVFILAILCATSKTIGDKGVYLYILFLFVIVAFRGSNVGTDTIHYLSIYNDFNRSLDYDELIRRPEIIYVYLSYFLMNHGLSFRILIIFFSSISFIAINIAIKKARLSPRYAILIYVLLFYLLSFNISRQSAAISIVLLGYVELMQNRKKAMLKFLICIMLATFLHAASILAILAIPLKYVSVKKNILIYIGLVVFAINAIAPINVLDYLSQYFSDSIYAFKYGDVMNANDRTLIGLVTDGIPFMILLLILKKNSAEKTSYADNLFFLGIITTLLSNNMDSDVGRISLVFSIFNVYYIANYMEEKAYSTGIKSDWCLVVFIVFYTFFDLYNTAMGYGGLIPYYMDFKF